MEPYRQVVDREIADLAVGSQLWWIDPAPQPILIACVARSRR